MNGTQISGAGTLTADPEVRFGQSGVAVCSMNIAVNERLYNKDTKKYEDGEPTFLRAACFKNLAENVGENLRKGMRVVFTGTLKQKNWEKDGQKKSMLEVHLDDIGQSQMFAAKVGASKADDPWGSGPSF